MRWKISQTFRIFVEFFKRFSRFISCISVCLFCVCIWLTFACLFIDYLKCSIVDCICTLRYQLESEWLLNCPTVWSGCGAMVAAKCYSPFLFVGFWWTGVEVQNFGLLHLQQINTKKNAHRIRECVRWLRPTVSDAAQIL